MRCHICTHVWNSLQEEGSHHHCGCPLAGLEMKIRRQPVMTPGIHQDPRRIGHDAHGTADTQTSRQRLSIQTRCWAMVAVPRRGAGTM